MGKINVEYQIAMANNPSNAVTLLIDLSDNGLNTQVDPAHESWTPLTYQQCPGCPLSAIKHRQCPVAVRLSSVAGIFNEIASYDQVNVTARVGNQTTHQTCSAEQVLSSVMGLLIASSACPYTAFFRPLALNHQPLASEAETTYTSVATYLTQQFIRMSEGHQPDLQLNGLHEIYARMHELNVHIAKRLQNIDGAAPILIGLSRLDNYAVSIPHKLRNSHHGFRDFYAGYLEERERELRGQNPFQFNDVKKMPTTAAVPAPTYQTPATVVQD